MGKVSFISFSGVGCLDFSNFVSHMKLIGLPLIGWKFTWFLPYDGVASRLDRILASNGWLDFWGLKT